MIPPFLFLFLLCISLSTFSCVLHSVKGDEAGSEDIGSVVAAGADLAIVAHHHHQQHQYRLHELRHIVIYIQCARERNGVGEDAICCIIARAKGAG